MTSKVSTNVDTNLQATFVPELVEAPTPQVLDNNLLDQVVGGNSFELEISGAVTSV